MDAVSGNLSRAVYFEKLHPVQNWVQIGVYADIVQAQTNVNHPAVSGIVFKRKIKGFSNQSRHAMIEFLAKVVDVPDLFVTLTYSDDIAGNANERLKADFEKFRHQLEYHYPNVRAMWRIEFVPRKSGRHMGKFIPHLHLLVWLPDDTPQARIDKILENDGQLWRNAWHKITHSTDEHHLAKFGCKVEPIKSRKHAYAYCSKYLAKETFELIEFGRRWGRIGTFEQLPEYETELSFREYVHFKRLLCAYIKADALKRHKRQKITIPYRPIPLSHYMSFLRQFKRISIELGLSVFGLGFISQDAPIGTRTIYKMIRHARQLAVGEKINVNSVAQ